MILPATSGAVLLLCLLVFVCWGSWILPWRLAPKRPRFEIVAVDFAIGAFLFALAAAFTLGTMGSEMAFTDSLMVSGHRAQAALLASGFAVGLANVALIAAIVIGGVSLAFPVAGVFFALVFALIFTSTSGLHHPTHLVVGSVLSLGVVGVVAARIRRSSGSTSKSSGGKVNVKGIGLAILGGGLLAVGASFARYGTSGELGVAPYAALVFVSVAALLPTVAAVFFLFNFPIDGTRLHANAYFAARLVQHGNAALCGAIWSAGLLGCFLLRSAPAEALTTRGLPVYAVLGSFVLATVWGIFLLKHPESVRSRTGLFSLIALVLAAGLYFLGFAVTS